MGSQAQRGARRRLGEEGVSLRLELLWECFFQESFFSIPPSFAQGSSIKLARHYVKATPSLEMRKLSL